jgi:Retinal pigment epithelial membrane protein
MNARSRFLEGAFAPVAEEITAFDLPVTGRVPAELSGRYLRNGPNPLGLDDPNYHWFLGPGKFTSALNSPPAVRSTLVPAAVADTAASKITVLPTPGSPVNRSTPPSVAA